MKSWFHEIGGNGPDWFLQIKVGSAAIARVRAAVRALTLADLRRYTEVKDGVELDHYVNQHRLRDFVANLEGHGRTNIWIYNWIQIGRGAVAFERGYSGQGGGATTDEQRVIAAILADRAVAIERWSVGAGGQGYDWVDIAEGADAGSLIEYLE